jgi:hypothetical protein
MVLPSTSYSLETGDILEVMEQSGDEEVCNYDSGCEVDVSKSAESVSPVINSEEPKKNWWVMQD